ncbi:MAG: hypothetical protein LBG29_09430, partial [Synergistaceae bacterium]|nr:hypothetical protein [Synergistaceae bacterium]
MTKAQEYRQKLERYQRARDENDAEVLDGYESRYQAFQAYYRAARRAKGFFEAEGMELPFKGDGPENDAIHSSLTVAEIEVMTRSANDTYARIRRECDARFEAEKRSKCRTQLSQRVRTPKAWAAKCMPRTRECRTSARTHAGGTGGASSGDSSGDGGSDSSDDPEPPRPRARAQSPHSLTPPKEHPKPSSKL